MTSGLAGWKTIGLSLMWIMFAYSGWNASTYLGAEIKNPSRNLPGSLIYGPSLSWSSTWDSMYYMFME